MLVNAKDYRYATTTINIREKASTKSKIVGKFYWNNKINCIEKINNWYAIRYKGQTRYVAKKYTKKKKNKSITYPSPSSNSFKSCEPGNCITNNPNIPQGRLKQQWKLDYKTGVYMVGDRYCVAVGSYYTKTIGTKLDLVLSNNGKKHVLKCILADSKADCDTVNNHRVHSDGSVAEFVINSAVMPHYARYVRGDVSFAGKQFMGKIVQIKVYKQGGSF